jgi:glycerophosphoryl diester phosphodiesterase
MITVAHRGVFFPKDKQNTYAGVCALNKKDVDMVEIDVRYSTDRKVVLCHDRECRNERKNDTLLSFLNKCFDIPIMLDIKAFGILEAQRLARSVVDILSKSQHKHGWLCSFNEYCVAELLSIRENDPNDAPAFRVGVISAGIPLGMFNHLDNIDFVSLDYNCVCEEVVECLHSNGLQVFVWVVNDPSMGTMMKNYGVDGMIRDFSM